MLDQPMDDYEGSYGNKIEKLYLENKDEFSKRGINPESFSQALFKSGKNVSEGDTYETWAQRNKMDRFAQNVSAFEQQQQQTLLDNQTREKNLAERGDFARGVASGVDQLQATAGGGLLMGLGKLASYAGGDNVVSKYLTGKGLDVYQEQMRQASLNPTKSLLSDKEGQWINEDLKDPGDYFDAIAGTLGNLVPSMAVSLISGGVGGKIAQLAGKKAVDKTVGFFVKNQAERMLGKGWGAKIAETASAEALKGGVALDAAKLAGEEAVRKAAQGAAQKYVGQRVGTILGTTALESTGAFADTVNHMREKFLADGMSPEQALIKATDETSATFAMSTGLAAGMVEIFGGNIRLLDMVLGDMGGKTAKELVKAATHARANPGIRGKALNMMRDLMVEAVKQAPAEFGQEAAQEILSMSNVDFADPDFQLVSQENFKRVVESGLAGAIGGVGGGFATEVGARAKALVGGQETPESRARDLEVQIARQKDMLARGMDKSLPNLAAALAENEAEFQTLQQHLGNVKTGVSYQDAVAKIGTELPGADGKPFTTKALKNLIRHGNLEKLEDGTIKPESLEAFIAQKKGVPRQVDPEVQAKAGDVLAVDPVEVAKTPEQAELLQIKTELDAQAHQAAATSPLNNLPEPTEEEKENGDYPVSSVQVGDMNISIENPRGSERKGVDEDGREWSTLMRNHYGYVDGSVGADKDRVDVFLSDEPEKGKVFIINQVNPKTGDFDEHKAMVGFETEEEAREAYLSNYEEGWKGLGSVGVMEHAEFKDWAMSNKAKKPFENTVEQAPVVAEEATNSDLYSSLTSEVEDDFFDEEEQEAPDESYYDNEVASVIEEETEKQETVESPNREIFETGIIPRDHKIERLGPNEAFVYSQDEGSTADLKGSSKAAAQFEADGGAVVPIRMRRQAKGPDGKPLVTEKGSQVFEFSGTQAVFSDMANLVEHASANPEMKFALPEMGRKAGVHPRLFRGMVQASGLAEAKNVALSEQLRGEKEKPIALTSDMLEEMERLAHGIQEGRKRKVNTMATEERLAGLQAGVLQWIAGEANEGRNVDRKLVAHFIQHIDSYTRTASSWMKYRNKQAVSPAAKAAAAKPERTGESLFDAEDLDDGYLETVDQEMSREDVEETSFDAQVDEDDENYMELYLEKRNLFVDTLTEHFGADAVQKFEEYGLFNFDQFAGRRRAVYATESGEAIFDPMKANDKKDVLRMFYHEVGVHHGLESLIKKVVGENGWDNFKTSILKEMTGRSTQSGDLFRRIYNEVRAVYVDAPDIKSPKFLAMRGKSMQELMMDDSFFHEFLGRVANKHDWTTKKQPSWATWLRDVITRFFRTLGFQFAPTFEEIGHLIQGSVANILAEENRGIAPERLKKANVEAMARFSGMEDKAEWRTSPERIDSLAPNQVFVFGSNTAGIHGAGAALQAKNKFGAQLGKGRGMTGQTYALPTKSKSGSKLVTMPLAAIAREVDAFMAYAAAHPDKEFLVTAVGTGLAGYKPFQIAELFNKHTPLPNVLLPASFVGHAQAGSAPRTKAGGRTVAVIGTAGRDKNKPMTKDLWDRMLADASARVSPEDTLISGGAAWADHLAVTLFLEGKVAGLKLRLPAPLSAKGFAGGQGTAGGAANYYHSLFSKVVGRDTIAEIREAIAKGAEVSYEAEAPGYGAMFARNKKVAAESNAVLAYTFGEGDTPADGGTQNTWNASMATDKQHVSLGQLSGQSVHTAKPAPTVGINISSYETGLGHALTNFSRLPVVFNGKKYARAEDAYQAEKKKLTDLSDENVKALMVRVLTAKLQQHPGLVKQITERGGISFLNQSTHNLIKDGKELKKDDRWVGKNGLFMQSLREAYSVVSGATVSVSAKPAPAKPAPAKPAPAKPAPAKTPLEDGTIPFASVLNRQKKTYDRNSTSGRQLTEAERARQAIEREQSASALVHTLYGRITWEEAVDPYELSRQITNLEGFDFTLRSEQTLKSAAELGIVLRKPERTAPTLASIQAKVADINRAMATAGLGPVNNPVATGQVAQALQDMYSRLAAVADDPATVDKIYWNAVRLKNLVTSAGKLKKKPQFKKDGEKVDVFESDAEHAVRQGNIAVARGHFGHEWSQMIDEIKRWHKAFEDYRSGKADIAKLIANMRVAKNRRRHAINEAVKNGALQYGVLGQPAKIPSRMAVSLKPVAYLAEKNKQLRVNMDKREATAIRVLAEGTKRALQKIYGAVQRVGSLPGTRMSEKDTAIINEANLSQAEKGFPQEKILGSVSAQFARELVDANQSAVEKDRQRREQIDKQGIESIDFTIPQLKPAADLGALLRRELVGFGNTGQVARRYQALAGKTVKQLVAEIKDGLRRAGLFVEQFAGTAVADHLLLGSNELGSFETQDQGQIVAGNMKFLDQALASLGEKYGVEITLRRGAPLPALGNLQLPSGNVVTELAALRRSVELFGEYKGLTVDELFLGVFGLGNPYAENKFVFENLPEALLEKFIKAGLAERTRKDGILPTYHLPKDLRAHFNTNYTLYSEIFNLDTPRQATWLDFSIIPSGQGQRLQDMRAFGPGAILMKGEQLFVVGPDYEVREWAEAGKPRYERVFTLNPIVSNISDGKIAGSKIKVEMPTKVDEFSLGDYTIVPRFWDLLPTAAVESTDKETNKVTYKNHYYLGADLLAAVDALSVRQKLEKLVAETGQTGIESTAHTQIVQDADGAQFLVLTNSAHDQLVFKVASGEITVAQKYSDEQAIRLVADELAKAGRLMAAPLLTDSPSKHITAIADIAMQARGRINELLAEGRVTSTQAATMTVWLDTATEHIQKLLIKPSTLYKAYEKMGVVSALPRGRQDVEDFLEKHWPEKLYPAYPKFLRGELSESDYMAIITKAVPDILDYQIEISGANLGTVAATIFRLSRLSRDEREAEAQRLFVEAMRNGIDGSYAQTGGRAMSGDAEENNFADEDSFGNEGSTKAQAIELASEALVADALLPEAEERDELLLQKTLRADLPAPADLNELLNKVHGKGAADALFAVLKKSMPETGWTIEKLMARETPLAPLQTFRLLNLMLALDQGKVTSLGLSHSGLRYAAQHAIEKINIPMADGSVMAFGQLDEATRGQFLDYVGRGPWFKHIWDSLGAKIDPKKKRALWTREKIEKLAKYLYPYKSAEKGRLGGLLDDFEGKSKLDLDSLQIAMAMGGIPLELPYFMQGMPYVDTQTHLAMIRNQLRRSHFVRGSDYAMAQIEKGRQKAEDRKFYDTKYVGKALFEQTLREQAAEIALDNFIADNPDLDVDAIFEASGLSVSDVKLSPDVKLQITTGSKKDTALDNRKDEKVTYEKTSGPSGANLHEVFARFANNPGTKGGPLLNVRFGYAGNPYQQALAIAIERTGFNIDANAIIDEVITDEFRQPALDGSGLADPMEAGYFIGLDGYRYNMIADAANFSLEEGGSQEVSDHISPTTGDLTLAELMNKLEPGSYAVDKGGKSGNAGFSPTVMINGKTYSLTKSNPNELSPFGESLLQQLRRRFDEVLAAPQKLLPSERKRVENLAVAFAQYEEAYGKYEAEKLRKKRVLGYGGLRVGPNRKWNKVVEAPNRNLIQLSIIQMLQPFALWREGDAASIEIHGPNVRADDPRSFSSVWPDDVLDGLRRDRGRTLSDLRTAAGMVDRNGTMHIFTGALIGSDGKLDQRELMKTVFHEFVGHIGLRRLLGAEYDAFMLQVFDKYLRRDLQRAISRQAMISLAEEFVAGRAERVRYNEQTGKFENSEVGTVFDRIAAMIIRKFRQIMQAMGITVKLTGVEVRDVLRGAFAGSQVAGRTGFSAFVPKGFIPMENIGSYADFGKWKGNTADNILEKTGDMLRPWEALVRSITSWDGQALRAHEDVLYGMRTLKTRIADAIAHVADEEKAFADMLAGKQFSYDDLGAVLRALHAKERIEEGIRIDSARYRARLMEKDVVRIINDQLNSLTSYFYNLPDDVRPSDDVIEKKIEKKKKKMQSFHTKEELVSYLVADHYKMISKPSRRIKSTGEIVTDARYFDGEIGSQRAERILKLAEQRGWIRVADDGSLSGMMAPAVRKILGHNMQGLDHALEAEMITQEQYDALKSKYRYFVPIQGPKAAQSSLRTASGFRLDAGNRFSEVFQSGTSIGADNLDPISQTFTNLRTRIGEAETNKMNRTIAGFALGHPNPEVFGVKASKEVLDATREQLGLVDGSPEWEALKLKYGFSELAEASVYEQRLFEQDNGLAPAYLDGHLIQVEIRHEGLRESYNRFARPERIGRMMQALGKVNRWMTMINTMLAPEFWAGQLTRDPGTALATLSIRERVAGIDGRTFAKQTSKRIHRAMKVLYKVNFGKDLSNLSAEEQLIQSYIKRFEKSGGKIQFAMMETALQVEQNLRKLVAVAKGEASPALRAKEKVKAGVDTMRKFSDAIENGTRLAVFVTAMENGATEQEAAMLSREITVDFDRKGQLGQAINTLYMFSNAGIQGSLTILRTLKNNPERAVKTLSAIVGLSMSVALANLVMGDGDDGEPKIFGVSDEIRNNHMVLVIPGLDNVVKIPLPYGYAFFWAIGQELVNVIAGRKSAMAASAGVLSSLMNNFNPLETAASLGDAHGWIRMISPTITDPLFDIGMERTPFGTPLMPEKAYEDQPDSSRYWRSVSATSKWAAEGLNELTGGSGGTAGLVSISPETLDSMFETATGGLGKLLSRLTGMITSPVTGREVGVTDIPVLRRFVGEPAKWEDRGRFYDNFEEVQGVNTTFKNLQKNIASARTEDLRKTSIRDMNEFRTVNGHILALRSDANNTYKQVKEIDDKKERLYKSGLPDSEIQPKLNELNERQRIIYQAFNKRYYEIVDAR